MTLKKFLKLTAIGMGSAASAITGCSKNLNEKSSVVDKSEPAEPVKPLIKAAGLEIIFGGDIPVKSCTSVAVSLTDDRGNKINDISTLRDVQISLDSQSKHKFEIKDGYVCALKKEASPTLIEEARVNEEAVVVASYKYFPIVTKSVKVTDATLEKIALQKKVNGFFTNYDSIDIPLGATTPASLGLYINGTNSDNTENNNLSDKDYNVVVKDKGNKVVDILKFDPDSKVWLITANHVKEAAQKGAIAEDYTVFVTPKNGSSVMVTLKIKVTDPVFKEYKKEDLPKNLPFGNRSFDIVALFSDGSEKNIFDASSGFTSLATIKYPSHTKEQTANKAKIYNLDTLSSAGNSIHIPVTHQLFTTSKEFLTLNISITRSQGIKVDPAFYPVESTKVLTHKFIVGDNAPTLLLTFKELNNTSTEEGEITTTGVYDKVFGGTVKEIAVGGIGYSRNIPSLFTRSDADKLAAQCVQMGSKVQVEGKDVEGLSLSLREAQIINLKDAINNGFIISSAGVICAKAGATIGNIWTVQTKYQDLKSNKLTVKAAPAIVTDRVSFGNAEAERKFVFKDDKEQKQDIFAYYLLSDNNISKIKVPFEVTRNFRYVPSHTNSPITVEKDPKTKVWSVKFKGGKQYNKQEQFIRLESDLDLGISPDKIKAVVDFDSE